MDAFWWRSLDGEMTGSCTLLYIFEYFLDFPHLPCIPFVTRINVFKNIYKKTYLNITSIPLSVYCN